MITQKNKLFQLLFCVFLMISFLSCKKDSANKDLDTPGEEFVKYSIDATDYIYLAPEDTLRYIGNGSLENAPFNPAIRVSSTGLLDNNYSVLSFTREGTAVNSDQALHIFGTTTVFGNNNPLLSSSPVYVHITEYGAIGEFIAGTFTGILFEAQNQTSNHNVTCWFRVRRTQ